MSFTADIEQIVAKNRNGLLGAHPSWKRVRLKEVATILNGYPFESSRFSKTEGTPLIRIRDIIPGQTETYYRGEYDSGFLVQPGEIVVGMDGDFHCAPWAGGSALLNQRVCKITPDETRCAKQFLRYVLPGYLGAINETTPSVTVKHLSSRTVADIPLPLPSLKEQRRIVAEIEKQFSRLEEGVGALRRVQANLKRYRAAVLKAACEGQLVPTEAELAKSKKRKFETGEELLARILAERRKNWQGRGKYKEPVAPDPSELGKLPEGWEWVSVEQIGRIETGNTPPKAEPAYYGDGVPLVKPGELLDHPVSEASDNLTAKGASVATIAPADSILVSCIGNLGKTALSLRDVAFNQQINAIIPVLPETARWIFYAVQQGGFRRQLESVASATTISIVNKSKFSVLAVPYPPLAEQSRIVAEVERRLSVVEELEATVEANLQRATRLRQSILQKAFEGKLA